MKIPYLPINVSLADKSCLVIGGGAVALRKIETLLDFGASVIVIAPDVHDRIEYYAGKKLLELHKRPYNSPEASKYKLVIAACDNEEVNRQAFDDCSRSGTLINVVDNPPLCTFIFPAVVKRDALTVAVSTSGEAPFLAARLKTILEDIFPKHWSKIAGLAGNFREKARNRYGSSIEARAACYERFLNFDWKAAFDCKMSDQELEAELDNLLEAPPETPDSGSERV